MENSNTLNKLNDLYHSCTDVSVPLMGVNELDTVFGSLYVELNKYCARLNRGFINQNNIQPGDELKVARVACEVFEKLEKILGSSDRGITAKANAAFQESVENLIKILHSCGITSAAYEESLEKISCINVLESIGIYRDHFSRPHHRFFPSQEESNRSKEAALDYARNNAEKLMKLCYNLGGGSGREVYVIPLDNSQISLYERVRRLGAISLKIHGPNESNS
ncbi:hypothetical protein MI467_28490 [Delftia acidovorans]|uniref:hypothetical protein n=1 Tax=Delftia acidovorans TaxID=80866 RepID=UPI001EFDD2F8|nr:hypothetical protein [Delftia acidovorans]MCG8990789.1 hypothetical protein [Delftia acidovorans]